MRPSQIFRFHAVEQREKKVLVRGHKNRTESVYEVQMPVRVLQVLLTF